MRAMPTVAPELRGRMITWRHALHQHPETGFEEHTTAAYVTAILTELGFEVHRGLGGTGVVASLKVGTAKDAIGLRADMDALNIQEGTADRPYASFIDGKKH